jgi:U3 small nucleolar ribonucleoprotein protein IMP3
MYEMGVISSKKGMIVLEKIAVSAFCRRRLPVVVHKLKMAETLPEAVTMIEQGHIKVGIDTITDPAFHVNRNLEDHITWVRESKYRKKVLQYNNKYDDFDLE